MPDEADKIPKELQPLVQRLDAQAAIIAQERMRGLRSRIRHAVEGVVPGPAEGGWYKEAVKDAVAAVMKSATGAGGHADAPPSLCAAVREELFERMVAVARQQLDAVDVRQPATPAVDTEA